MPCSDNGQASYEYGKLKERVDQIENLLCEAISLIAPGDFSREASVGLIEWYAAHQELDKQRRAKKNAAERAQELRRQAMAKLSKDEQMALGLRPEDI